MNPVDEPLLKNLDRLAKRVNSEEGIPMFLACEDLGPAKRKNIAARELNGEFVSIFLHHIDLVQKSRPGAPLTEIAKIVEHLAEQDFALPAPEKAP